MTIHAEGNAHTEEQGVVTLCGANGCCPTIDFTQEEIVIRDDFGGNVRLSREQWAALKQRFVV